MLPAGRRPSYGVLTGFSFPWVTILVSRAQRTEERTEQRTGTAACTCRGEPEPTGKKPDRDSLSGANAPRQAMGVEATETRSLPISYGYWVEVLRKHHNSHNGGAIQVAKFCVLRASERKMYSHRTTPYILHTYSIHTPYLRSSPHFIIMRCQLGHTLCLSGSFNRLNTPVLCTTERCADHSPPGIAQRPIIEISWPPQCVRASPKLAVMWI